MRIKFFVIVSAIAFLPITASATDDCLQMHAAARTNEIDQIEDILALGTPVDCRDPIEDDTTALMKAAGGGSVDATRVLLQHGANINEKDKSGWTALRYARASRDSIAKTGKLKGVVARLGEIIALLKEKGATE